MNTKARVLVVDDSPATALIVSKLLNQCGFSEVDRNHATLKVLVRPLVVWMWIGGFVIALGTLVCILPMKKSALTET